MNSNFPLPDPSTLLETCFYLFSFTIAASLPIACWRATKEKRATGISFGLVLLWLFFTGGMTLWEGFRSFEPPPPFILVVNLGLVGVIVYLSSPLGKRVLEGLSLPGLVLFQAFRFPLELLMHRAYSEGLMPVQMSFEGRNLDILTGISALVLGLIMLKSELPKWLLWSWNFLGLGLLINIVTVAILSTPSPWRQFQNDPPNVWVLDMPFVWLPMIMVLAAFFGHIAIFKKLRSANP